ncbi:hypothetical protein [Flavobacterium microcysteis]
MNKYKILYVVVIAFLISCKTERKNRDLAQNDITKPIENLIAPPFGDSNLIKSKVINPADSGEFDRSVSGLEKQMEGLDFANDLKDDISFYNEDKDSNFVLESKNTADFKVSSKYLLYKDFKLRFVSNSKFGNRIYLASFKNDKLVDLKWIYFHYQGEMGFTYYRFFYIDKNYTISIRDYEFTEDPYKAKPLLKYKINAAGKFTKAN